MRIVVDLGDLAIDRWEKLDVRNRRVGSDTIWDEKERLNDAGVGIGRRI